MKFFAPLLLAATASAHFKLTNPTSIGFDDDNESESPCGGFSVTSRTNETDFPSGGMSFTILSTHPKATWYFKAALLSDTSNFQYLMAPVSQSGIGTFCLENVPGPAAWAGKDGVVQVSQTATDGSLYQCVAVKFTDAAASSLPSVCKNSSGITASYTSYPSGAVIAGSNSTTTTSSNTSSTTATASATSATHSGAAVQNAVSVGSAALLAAAAYLL